MADRPHRDINGYNHKSLAEYRISEADLLNDETRDEKKKVLVNDPSSVKRKLNVRDVKKAETSQKA